MQYYDDAAGILRSIILSAIAPHRLAKAPPLLPSFPQESGDIHGSCQDLLAHDPEKGAAFTVYADSKDDLPER